MRIEDATNPLEWNAAALEMLDQADPQLVERLQQLILNRDDVVMNCGTLIYCIHEGGGKLSRETFERTILDASYEARLHALMMLRDGLVEGLT